MTISIGNLFSIFIFTIFLSCFNNTHRFMAKPPSRFPFPRLLPPTQRCGFSCIWLCGLTLLLCLFCCCCSCCFSVRIFSSYFFSIAAVVVAVLVATHATAFCSHFRLAKQFCWAPNQKPAASRGSCPYTSLSRCCCPACIAVSVA